MKVHKARQRTKIHNTIIKIRNLYAANDFAASQIRKIFCILAINEQNKKLNSK